MKNNKKEKQTKTTLVKHESSNLIPDASNIYKLSQNLLASKMFPQFKSVPEIVTVVAYGKELGLPPVASLNTMCVIHGRLSMEAKAMLAIATRRAKVTWEINELTEDECTMTFYREGWKKPIKVEFTRKDASNAGLLGKTSWKNYPKEMLFARCASKGIRQIAPDAVLGLYATEEMQDTEYVEKGKEEESPESVSFKPDEAEEEVVEAEVVEEKDDEEKPVDYLVGKPDTSKLKIAKKGEPKADEGMEFGLTKDGEVKEEEQEEMEFPGTEPSPAETVTPEEELDAICNKINEHLEIANVDKTKFKVWLYEYQVKRARKYCRKIGSNISLHKGDLDDLKLLQPNMTAAIGQFKLETEK